MVTPTSESRRRRILVTGASGLVGTALMQTLEGSGYDAVALTRHESAGAIRWSPSERRIERDRLNGFDAVVHLAGESIAEGRWTREKKRRIRESRVDGTRFLSEVLSELDEPPRVFVQASAVGYYGDRGLELVREDSAPGTGFLASVCQEWEAASEPLQETRTRCVQLRLGMVLSLDGGALPRMMTPIQWWVGGRLGSGAQIVSWIELSDLLAAVHHCLATSSLRGPVNCVAPETVTQAELVSKLGELMGRPTFLPAPEFALKLALGEMASEVLLASTRVEPARLLKTGFEFRYPSLDGALEALFEAEGLIAPREERLTPADERDETRS